MTSDDKDWVSWRSLSQVLSLKNLWIAPKVRFFRQGEGGLSDESSGNLMDSDRPWLSGTLACVLSSRMADRLSKVLLRYGEFLPADCHEGEFVVYHCMNQLDNALDIDLSKGGRSRDGRLLSLKKPVFCPEVVRGQDVFTIPAPNPYTIFVSDQFVQMVNSSGLVGMNFVPLWSDEGVARRSPADALTDHAKRRVTILGPLPQKAAEMIPQAIVAAEKAIGIDLACTSPEEIMQKVQSTIDENDEYTMADASLLAATLGTLWGEVVCREFGWKWAWVRVDDAEAAGIIAPIRSHVVFPQPYFYSLLAHRRQGPTSLELYNMIKSATFPVAEPNSCIVLA